MKISYLWNQVFSTLSAQMRLDDISFESLLDNRDVVHMYAFWRSLDVLEQVHYGVLRVIKNIKTLTDHCMLHANTSWMMCFVLL